jgi:hypothetical protein
MSETRIPLWRNVALAAAIAPLLAALPYVLATLPDGLFLIPVFYMVAGIPAVLGAVPFVLWLRRNAGVSWFASAGVGALVGLAASVLFGVGVDLRDLASQANLESHVWNFKSWVYIGVHGLAAGAVGGAIMSRLHFKRAVQQAALRDSAHDANSANVN